MRKLTDIENPSLSSLYRDEHIVTFHDDIDTDSYNIFDIILNAIKDGFDIKFRSLDDYGDSVLVIIISKDGFYENYAISNTSDEQVVILRISKFIKSSIDEINKKINSPKL